MATPRPWSKTPPSPAGTAETTKEQQHFSAALGPWAPSARRGPVQTLPSRLPHVHPVPAQLLALALQGRPPGGLRSQRLAATCNTHITPHRAQHTETANVSTSHGCRWLRGSWGQGWGQGWGAGVVPPRPGASACNLLGRPCLARGSGEAPCSMRTPKYPFLSQLLPRVHIPLRNAYLSPSPSRHPQGHHTSRA